MLKKLLLVTMLRGWNRRRNLELERQVIVDRSASELARKQLLEFQAENMAIESTGSASAEARAKAEAARIEGDLTVNLAQQDAAATRIRAEVELANFNEHTRS